MAADAVGGDAAADLPGAAVGCVEPGQVHGDGLAGIAEPGVVEQGQDRPDVAQVEVPPAEALVAEPEPERSARRDRPAGAHQRLIKLAPHARPAHRPH